MHPDWPNDLDQNPRSFHGGLILGSSFGNDNFKDGERGTPPTRRCGARCRACPAGRQAVVGLREVKEEWPPTRRGLQGYKVVVQGGDGGLLTASGGGWLAAAAHGGVWRWLAGGSGSRWRLAVARAVWWRLLRWRGRDSGRRG